MPKHGFLGVDINHAVPSGGNSGPQRDATSLPLVDLNVARKYEYSSVPVSRSLPPINLPIMPKYCNGTVLGRPRESPPASSCKFAT